MSRWSVIVQFIISALRVRSIHWRHTWPNPKPKLKPHYAGYTLSFWYKHIKCLRKEGCWIDLIKDQWLDWLLSIDDTRVYFSYVDECDHGGIYNFKTDLGVSEFSMCVVSSVYLVCVSVSSVLYPCTTLTCAKTYLRASTRTHTHTHTLSLSLSLTHTHQDARTHIRHSGQVQPSKQQR